MAQQTGTREIPVSEFAALVADADPGTTEYNVVELLGVPFRLGATKTEFRTIHASVEVATDMPPLAADEFDLTDTEAVDALATIAGVALERYIRAEGTPTPTGPDVASREKLSLAETGE